MFAILQAMSTTSDLRVSLPLGLLCVLALSWSLLSALQESLTPDDAASSPTTENQEKKPNTLPDPKKPEGHVDPKISHVNDGLGDDNYWDDGYHAPAILPPARV